MIRSILTWLTVLTVALSVPLFLGPDASATPVAPWMLVSDDDDSGGSGSSGKSGGSGASDDDDSGGSGSSGKSGGSGGSDDDDSGGCGGHCDPTTPYCLADQSDCPCGNDDPAAGCINGSGQGALITGEGSASVTADDLQLTASGLPANTTVLFLAADAARRAPFLDGLLCVGGPTSKIYRLPPALNSGPSGAVTFGPGLIALSNTPAVPIVGGIVPGDTWYFQTFFRDMGGSCGTGGNVSSAVSITFTP